MPPRAPAILALDFDGVICDGMREYFAAAWRAWHRLRPSIAPEPPAGFFERFARVRPVVETGWEMPLVIMALLAGTSEAELLGDWRPEALRAESGLEREEIAAALDRVRDEWIAADETDWLDHHHFYPGVIERLRRLARGPTRAVVITTKEGRFARNLLGRQGVELGPEDIYGKEERRPKHAILRELLATRPAAGDLWFVEDRLKTLEAARTAPGLDDVGLFLAAWGYNTPQDREAARRDGRVVLLSLEQFGRDFAAWVEAGRSVP